MPTLATRFAVSATPVREAVLELESRGFLESVRNKGFRVTRVAPEPSARSPRSACSSNRRRWSAGQSFPAEQLPELRALADGIVEGARTGEMIGYTAADREFHLRLAGLLGNPVLVERSADCGTGRGWSGGRTGRSGG